MKVQTRIHKYGTVINAKPAAKLPIPTDKVRIVVGYCIAVNVGISALVAPIEHFTGIKKYFRFIGRIKKSEFTFKGRHYLDS